MSTAPKPLLLIVDDDPQVCALLSTLAQREGFEVTASQSGVQGVEVLRHRPVDLMFLDLHLPEVNGLEVLKAAQGSADATHIVLMTGMASIETAVEAIKLGAEDYLQKPLDLSRLKQIMGAVRGQFETRAIIQANDAALAERLEFCGMVGRSRAISDLFALIRRFAPHARSVLITGETGTGKELVARAFHELGGRADKRFVPVNCAAIVETLFESELFGHVRGAFTGAADHKPGLFEAATGGTLFLDEVGELPLSVQSKLLRVLETAEVQRVGAVESRRVDVRAVAATNRLLDREIKAGRFRSDLYYRLNVLEVNVPPLRDRIEDIPYLTAAFLRQYSNTFGKSVPGITASAESLLMQSAWPGNVRQLRNVIERACLLSEGSLLTERDIAAALGAVTSVRASGWPATSLPPTKEQLIEALRATGGNKVMAARRLGISRRALYRLIEKYEPHS